jgi:hypothetical protein
MKLPLRIISVMLFMGVFSSPIYATVASEVLALTSNKHVRMVWSRYFAGTIDTYTNKGRATYKLMSYSSTTDQVVDVLNTTGNYFRAKITWDGSKILYNNVGDLYQVDFSGSNNHLVMKNAALNCYWYNPVNGRDYVFVSRGTGGTPTNMDYPAGGNFDPLWRICLTDTTEKTQISMPNGYAGIWLAVSNDGTRLAGDFPWTSSAGGAGMVITATGAFTSFNVYGCWAATPPDNSYRFALYDVDAHNEWAVFNADKSGKHILNLVPTGTNQGTYSARFAINDPHYITLIAPMGPSSSGFNTSVGFYFGKVDDNLTQMQGWVKIAGNGECNGVAWIDQSATVQPALGSSASQLNFSATVGGSNPTAQQVTITNTGTGALTAVAAVSDTGWLTVSGGSAGNTQTLTNQVNIANLAVGTHTAHVTVSGGGASNTVSYTAVLTISQDAPHLASIALTSMPDSIGPNARVFITARCKDQRNNPFSAIVNWSVTGGGTLSRTVSPKADSIDTASFVSNGALGMFLIIATNGSVKDTAKVVVTSSLIYSIALLEPLGTKNYNIGDTMRIRWTASSNIPGVVIHISLNDGMTWNTVNTGKTGAVDRNDSYWGNFGWKIPATIRELGAGGIYSDVTTVSDKVLMEVRGYFDEAVGQTPTAFSIKNGSTAKYLFSIGSALQYPQVFIHNNGTMIIKTNGKSAIRVCDSMGKMRRMIGMTGGGSYSISGLQSGVYIVNIIQDGHSNVKTIRMP